MKEEHLREYEGPPPPNLRAWKGGAGGRAGGENLKGQKGAGKSRESRRRGPGAGGSAQSGRGAAAQWLAARAPLTSWCRRRRGFPGAGDAERRVSPQAGRRTPRGRASRGGSGSGDRATPSPRSEARRRPAGPPSASERPRAEEGGAGAEAPSGVHDGRRLLPVESRPSPQTGAAGAARPPVRPSARPSAPQAAPSASPPPPPPRP